MEWLKDILYPLPDPEREAYKFFTSPLQHLVYDQIKELVRFVLDEVRKSKALGLYIKNEHIEKEELIILVTINAMGGEKAQQLITETMWKHFEQETLHYFVLSKERGEAVHNKYNCHLESVLNRLLHEIYDVPNKQLYTAR